VSESPAPTEISNARTTVHISTAAERFIASQVQPRLAADETILHTGYLITDLHATSPVGVILAGISLRACFIALTQTRAFFLWSQPGRVGAFKPLLECGSIQIVDRSRITASIKRSGLLTKALWLCLDREVVAFHLKRKVRDLPAQAQMLDALGAKPA
jgi:hypothetical protein